MDPEAVRATIVILLLAIGSVGAAWTYDAMVGPPAPDDRGPDDDAVLTLVGFQSRTIELSTGVVPFEGSGSIRFDPIPLPVGNATSVSVTIQVSMNGPSVRDTIGVSIVGPAGDRINGEVQRQANPNGYRISESVVEGWSLGEMPESTHYPTDDEGEALRWAAENHTDRSDTGDWQSEVTLSPPLTPLRSGNASLTFTFTYYEAQAFAPLPVDEDGRTPRGFFDARAAASPRVPAPPLAVAASTAFPEPS